MITLVNSKKKQEHLQEIRHPHKDSIKFRKRKQEELEVTKQLKEDLKKLNDNK